MDVTATLDAPVTPARLFDEVSALDGYAAWIDIVHRIEPHADGSWGVELRGKVGPFARSKRLRMERTVLEPTRRVVFERRESDGRTHAAWVLTATIDEVDSGARLTMHLHYGGSLFTGGVLEKMLADQIVRGRERLLARLGA
jgi:uncharacterized protein YndB with AHSA1/START domain